MDPVTIVGISLACIVVGEAILTKIYRLIFFRLHRQEQGVVPSQVSNTT